MPVIPTYRESTAPPSERCFKLEVRPTGWKARMWRAFDDSVQPMLRLDAAIAPRDVDQRDVRDALELFATALRRVSIYLERGAGSPLPLSWSVGWFSVDRERPVIFLHRVLDDPFGNTLALLFRARESRADVTLSLSPYEIGRDRLVFAVRDYDIGAGADFSR